MLSGRWGFGWFSIGNLGGWGLGLVGWGMSVVVGSCVRVAGWVELVVLWTGEVCG